PRLRVSPKGGNSSVSSLTPNGQTTPSLPHRVARGVQASQPMSLETLLLFIMGVAAVRGREMFPEVPKSATASPYGQLPSPQLPSFPAGQTSLLLRPEHGEAARVQGDAVE